MAVENLSGSLIMTNYNDQDPKVKILPQYDHGHMRMIVDKVEASANASVNSTYSLGRIRSSEVLSLDSKIHWDDLTATGSPVLDVGLFAPEITDDDNALAASLDVTTAGSAVIGPSDIANAGKMAWEYVAGLTEDPKCWLEIKATLKTAAIDAGGTIALEAKVTQA